MINQECAPKENYRSLISMVVYRAVLDCQGKMSDLKTDQKKRRAEKEAKEWIASADCQRYCDYIDVDHNSVVKASLVNEKGEQEKCLV